MLYSGKPGRDAQLESQVSFGSDHAGLLGDFEPVLKETDITGAARILR